jgi:hypothetical protein
MFKEVTQTPHHPIFISDQFRLELSGTKQLLAWTNQSHSLSVLYVNGHVDRHTHTHTHTHTRVIHSAFRILHSSHMFDVLQSFMGAHNITTLNRSNDFHMSVVYCNIRTPNSGYTKQCYTIDGKLSIEKRTSND